MTPGDLQLELKTIVDSVRTTNIRQFEEASLDEAQTQLLPVVLRHVEEAIAALGKVLARYESQSTVEGEEHGAEAGLDDSMRFYQGIETLFSERDGAIRITDLAFMARWELVGKRAALRDAPSLSERWSIISECGSARRKLTKSLIAVEVAIASHEGRESLLESQYITEQTRSVAARRVYARLRRDLLKLPPVSEATCRANLRAGGTAIAMMIGQDAYEDLRVSDRIELREIQGRILEWLRDEGDCSFASARRIFEDLTACANLFLQINHRAELIEHDEALIRDAMTEMHELQDTASLAEGLRPRMKALLGRNEELDALIDTKVELWGDWLPVLTHVLASMGRDAESSPKGPSRGSTERRRIFAETARR